MLRRWVLSIVCVALFSASVRAGDARPVNVVVMVADDLGQRDLGCYGSTFYETPALDRLAAGGIRLTRAYSACPVCSPTRAALTTGRYPQRSGITDYIGAAQPEAWKRNTRHLPAAYNLQLALPETTVAEILKARGYATFFGGKWHLGGEGFLPEQQGFDVNFGGLAQGGPYGGNKYFSPYGNSKLADGPEGEHLPDRLASEAVRFMESHRDQPFLIWLPFYDVHTPLMARDDLQRKYELKRANLSERDVFADEPPRKVRMSQDHAVYGGMVEAMDQAAGKILQALDRLQLTEQTLVIFTSDNGGLSTSEGSPTSNQPLRAGKGWLYEGGIRTPCLMRLPRQIPAGVTCETPVMSIDYLPTILDFCEVNAEPQLQFDGISLKTQLQQPGRTDLSRTLYWQYPHYGNQGGAPGAVVLEDGWKLIEWFDDGRLELFRVYDDISEQQNVAADHPQIVQHLQSRLHAWQSAVGAKRSTVNPAWDPQKKAGR
ncbi:MAG TPA: sulfatase [Planctomycetaceae bacterium]|nr:sulfatase [Planctomycetaceae bacterium]